MFFVIDFIIIIAILRTDVDISAFVGIYIASTIIFLLPRGIALCYVNSKSRAPPVAIAFVQH